MRTKSQVRSLQEVRTQISGWTFKGVCFKDENQKSQKLVCFKGLLRGWQTALWSPNLLPCQAGVKWTLVGSACSICPQLLMITYAGLSTWCCPHEPLVTCQVVCIISVLRLLHPCLLPTGLILHSGSQRASLVREIAVHSRLYFCDCRLFFFSFIVQFMCFTSNTCQISFWLVVHEIWLYLLSDWNVLA